MGWGLTHTSGAKEPGTASIHKKNGLSMLAKVRRGRASESGRALRNGGQRRRQFCRFH